MSATDRIAGVDVEEEVGALVTRGRILKDDDDDDDVWVALVAGADEKAEEMLRTGGYCGDCAH